MAKVTAPLLSFGAHGQVAKTLVSAKWKGVPYMRQYVIPSNPNSVDQQKTRSAFSYINGVYKFASSYLTAPWEAFVKGKALIARNAIIKTNLPLIRTAADNSAFEISPGANGGIAPDSIAAADAGSQVATVTLGVPDVPAGWTITDSVAVLLPKDAVADITDYTTYADHSGDATGVVSVTAVAGDFVASGYFEMTKSDGAIAYGASKTTTVTLA